MATTPEVHKAAKDERDALESVISSADLAVLAIVSGSAMIDHALASLAIIPAFLRWRAQREKAVQQRLIEDPPRDDYRDPAKLDLETWRPDVRLPVQQVVRELIERYVNESIKVVAFETAMIEAVEKQMGALAAADAVHAKARRSEAEGLADDTALMLHASALTIDDLMFAVTQALVRHDQRLVRLGMSEISAQPALTLRQIHEFAAFGIPETDLGEIQLEPKQWLDPRDSAIEFAAAARVDSWTRRKLAEVLGYGTLVTA